MLASVWNKITKHHNPLFYYIRLPLFTLIVYTNIHTWLLLLHSSGSGSNGGSDGGGGSN